MQKVILDTNFILSCVEKKIDFFEELEFAGFRIIIPFEVVGELKKLASGKKTNLAQNSELALRILEKNNFEKINLSKQSGRKKVDELIVFFARKNPQIAVATLDREIKNKTRNSKVAIRGGKKLEII